MEFGRLKSLDDVAFDLPPEPLENPEFLSRLEARAPSRVRMGLAGWSDRGFLGVLHPPGTRSADFLARYSRAFGASELNSTYYGVEADRIARWTAAVPDDFRFCPKLPGAVTHESELVGADAVMERFVELVGGMGEKLGRAWGVLPPSFGPSRFEVLARFLERWAAKVPLAFELRHPAWFSDPRAAREVFRLLETNGVAAVLTDVAGRRDVLHMRLTAPDTIVRFVGNRPHPSDHVRLDAWAERIAGWTAGGLHTAYVFLHQRQDPAAVPTAREFAERYESFSGERIVPALPSAEAVAAPRQAELF